LEITEEFRALLYHRSLWIRLGHGGVSTSVRKGHHEQSAT